MRFTFGPHSTSSVWGYSCAGVFYFALVVRSHCARSASLTGLRMPRTTRIGWTARWC